MPDRADADDLAREVLVVVVVEHDAPVGRQRLGVVDQALADDLLGLVGHRLGRADDHRRLLLDPVAAVDLLGELRQRAEARALARLGEVLLRRLQRRPCPCVGGELGEQLLDVDAGVPDVEEAHRRRRGHRRPVRRGGGARGRALLLGAVAVVARRDDEARRQALDVPLERRGQRLVEVVEIEHQPPVGRREHPEVRQVRVPAALHAQPRRRRLREIPGHDRRAAAVERERRDDHPPVPDRHQLGHARRVLLLQDADRIRATVGSRPLGVRAERHRLALSAPLAHALLDRLGKFEHPTTGRLAFAGFLRFFAFVLPMGRRYSLKMRASSRSPSMNHAPCDGGRFLAVVSARATVRTPGTRYSSTAAQGSTAGRTWMRCGSPGFCARRSDLPREALPLCASRSLDRRGRAPARRPRPSAWIPRSNRGC